MFPEESVLPALTTKDDLPGNDYGGTMQLMAMTTACTLDFPRQIRTIFLGSVMRPPCVGFRTGGFLHFQGGA